MPVASSSSRLSYASIKQSTPIIANPDLRHLTSRPSSPLRAGPNTAFTSFSSEGNSQRYHEVKLGGDLSRVSWVWGAPSSLGRLLNKDEESIRIEVVSEADAVGEGKMLNPYSDFAPKNNNIVEPDLNAGDNASHSIRSWTISEDEEEEREADSPASFTARFPHTEPPKPPESLQDVNNEYEHPSYSHTQFQDRASIASSNTLSYVSTDDDKPVEALIHRQSAHKVHPSIHHFQQPEPVAAQPEPWDGDHNYNHHGMSESYDNGQHVQPHSSHDPWGDMPHSGVDEGRSSFQDHGAVFPNFAEAGPSKLPPNALANFPPDGLHHHQYQQHQLPPLSTGEPFIPQRLSRASSISIRSGYGKYREPVLTAISAPGVRQSQAIAPITPVTPNVPAIPSKNTNNRSRFKFPIKLRPKNTKDLPKLPASRLLKKQSPSLKSRTTLVPQEQEIVELQEVDDGSSWVVYSH